jgi:hypothetical protein
MDAPVEINLSGTYDNEARTGNLHMAITAIDDAYYEQLHVRIALTESQLYYQAPNGSVWHHQTMRDMLPNPNGTSIELEYGQTVQLDQAFTVPAALNEDNCELVVWLQSDYIKEVYQAAHIPILDLIPNAVDDNPTTLPDAFTLAQNYPNPFNAKTTINYSLINESPVNLAVYDLGGRKVAQLVDGVQEAGDHRLVWDGTDSEGKVVSTGIYFYRLEANGQSVTKRMTLLK